MRIDQKRDDELARRSGSTKKTVMQILLFLALFAGAYYVSHWMFGAGKMITYRSFYELGVPRSVAPWAIEGFIAFLMVCVMQMFIIVGFFLGSPQGRAKTGVATVEATFEKNKPRDRFTR